MTYTTNLMDKLERWKADNAANDAIHDDMAAQAYVEQFALETFERAEKQVRANKATAWVAFPDDMAQHLLICAQSNSRHLPGSRNLFGPSEYMAKPSGPGGCIQIKICQVPRITNCKGSQGR